MITVEIKVNGCLIEHIYAKNIAHVSDTDGGPENLYDYEIYRVSKGQKTGEIISGSLTHLYEDGAEVLVQKILQDVKKRNGKKLRKGT
ncbi:MAG: hypothetical protein Q7R33_01800 [Nitrosarchaeum sp.]|nr:hypothetical protein [Nitrosarchaeum sp.]